MKIVCLWGKGGVCSFFYKFNLLIHRIAKREAMKKLNRVISQPLFIPHFSHKETFLEVPLEKRLPTFEILLAVLFEPVSDS